jgi:hypothetical protein
MDAQMLTSRHFFQTPARQLYAIIRSVAYLPVFRGLPAASGMKLASLRSLRDRLTVADSRLGQMPLFDQSSQAARDSLRRRTC